MIKGLNIEKAYTFGTKWLASWATLNWKYTLGLYSPESRSLVYDISTRLGFDSLGRVKSKLPQMSCNDVAPRLEAELLRPEAMDGNVSLLELLVLCSVVRGFNLKTAFEIGTFDGRTSLNLALNMKEDGRVYTLDLPPAQISGTEGLLDRGDVHYITNHRPGQLFENVSDERKSRIVQLLGDSASFDYTEYSNNMDLVFIDGAHSVDYVRRDTETALRLLRGGKGFVFWHDYDGCVGVIQAVDELQAQHPDYNIKHIAGTKLAYMHKVT